ncbi:hypothetical protein ACFL23_02610 [Patescibacteria group bacterium]
MEENKIYKEKKVTSESFKQKKLTINCFNLLNICGCQTDFIKKEKKDNYEKFLFHETDSIPLKLRVHKQSSSSELLLKFFYKVKGNEAIYDFVGDKWEICNNANNWKFEMPQMQSLNNRIIKYSDLSSMIALGKNSFYVLTNVWKRLDCNLLEMNINFCFISKNYENSKIAIMGPIKNDFWKLEPFPKIIKLKKLENNRVIVSPEKMPELDLMQKAELENIIRNFENGNEQVMTVKQHGWQETVYVTKHKNGWFLVFPLSLFQNKKNIYGIPGNKILAKIPYKDGENIETKLQEKINEIETGKEKIIILSKKEFGNVLARKDKNGSVIFFIGTLPKLTNEQNQLLKMVVELLKVENTEIMGIGNKYEEYGAQEIFISKNVSGQIIIMPQAMPKLTDAERCILNNAINTVVDDTAKITMPQKKLSYKKIADLTDQFIIS